MNATPINVGTSALTESFAFVVWYLPSTAIGEGIKVGNYTVVATFVGTERNVTESVTDLGFRVDNLEPGRRVDVTVTANYMMPLVLNAITNAFTIMTPAAGKESLCVRA